ncbi:isopentenyl-diphosphate delta-isomerase [Frondihabitans sp. PAMC 28766]|uniref:isopentenyl-diphosphate Delta-isomerase n=1 Tax=Frondihabitans sp. PAMC 28766 TaxID=1795630 RepID=UPI00078C44CA|nr:isopentenyl-diphosphate Delta-isomerase [Frondihabitans sp. PAMC 28766]AMM19221.1 isopentenyl-diphosphate delta-isomerase [Frondihabitans sp. PAMC 28766]
MLDEVGNPCGTYPKATVHTKNTPLHLAFSCHVVNPESGDILVTRRALTKATWPGVWTNSFCGHPAPGEMPAEALARRAFQELGMEVTQVESILPDFRYRAVDASGVVENEICPVFSAVAVGEPDPSPDEVAEWAWIPAAELRAAVAAAPFAWSPWLGWQLEQWPAAQGAADRR